MENVLELLPSVLDGHSIPTLKNFLDSCDEHVAFHGRDKKNDGYIKLVNVRLNESDSRLEGLLILKIALRQCSVETFIDNATSWMSHCLKGSYDKNPTVANISFGVLGSLLKTAVKFPEIKKYASANVVPTALEHTKREINSKTIQSLLECLIICIQEYPGPCGESSKYILNLLKRLLDSEQPLLSLAARCYALLSQVKGKGNSYKNVWKTNQMVLVNTLHHYLDLLFSNVDEIQTARRPCEDNIELLVIKKISMPASTSERMQHFMKIIKGLSKFLQAMLLGSFPVAKVVMPDAIVGLICRGLAVTCHSLGKITTDTLALGSVLSEVHTDLLKILISLITCCGRNLIQYGSVICKLVNQELKWTSTSEWPYDLDKPFRTLRSTVYSCLHCWLSIARTSSSIEIVIEEIVQHLLQDIHMSKPVVTLKAKSIIGKKNQAQYNFLSDSRSEKLGMKLANKGLCLHALKCLQLVLQSSTTYMKSSLCKIIQESIVTLLFEVQNKHDGPPVPYSNGACRKELYSTLLVLCMEPHPTFPSPLNYTLAIFKAGLMDPLSEVSVVCSSGLSSLEKIIHPSAPPLGSTLQYDIIQQYSEDITDKIDILLPNITSSNPQSIKDMPLSAFPNLNNVIVVKVYDNKRYVKEIDRNDSDCLNSDKPGTSSSMSFENNQCSKRIEKTTFHLNGVNAMRENCNIGDIISMNNFNGDIPPVVNDDFNDKEDNTFPGDISSCINNFDDLLEEKPSDKVSLLEKINRICDDTDMGDVHMTLKNKFQDNRESSLLTEIDDVVEESSIGLSEEPPVKKIKVSATVTANEITVETELKTENKDNVLNNSENANLNGEIIPTLDENEMMNCFVDIVQE